MVELFMLLGGLALLIGGGEILVRGSVNIAVRLQVQPIVIGLTIVAFGTSAPELLVSLLSALDNHADLALGNVVGSNICNLALVLGATALINPIDVERKVIRFDGLVLLVSSVLLVIAVQFKVIERWVGITFFTGLIVYLFLLFRSAKKNKAEADAMADEFKADEEEDPNQMPIYWLRDAIFVVLGIIGLTFGADWFIDGSKDLFTDLFVQLGAPREDVERIIGVIVLSLGTSLPEMVTSVVAAYRKSTDLAIGNLIGSNIFNILSILGLTAIIVPIPVNATIATFDILWMLATTVVVLIFMFTGSKLSRWEGGLLLLSYIGYTVMVIP